ncbi:hypothetical protein M422DRAFT_784119 [Sphaerobolus stellatus SS14]|uniref:Unplaced genomic scaffold SPHSTscaffold_195, whole genome shotgun sequence n=1 Tax=Sphaerobolus stellatus (strain SS14) TaxID=990650 RepID=A0A0C9UY68_SPHS4|nr:hypothetical protein M422DRAFT_784119 [Sphaerobolus stellatus SS14]
MARDNKRVRVQALTSERDAARARVRVLEEKLVNVALEGLARDGDVFEIKWESYSPAAELAHQRTLERVERRAQRRG